MELSINQVSEFLVNPVWLQIKRDLFEAIEEGRNQLEQINSKEASDIASLQGGIQRLREFLQLPDNYLEELREKKALSKEEE
jgi:hypothetical protein